MSIPSVAIGPVRTGAAGAAGAAFGSSATRTRGVCVYICVRVYEQDIGNHMGGEEVRDKQAG